MAHLGRVAITAAMITFAAPALCQAQRSTASHSASGAPPVSERVVASWYYERTGEEAPRLVFLVLYRGEPRWYMRDTAQDRHGGMGSSTASPDGRIEQGPIYIQHVAGGVELPIEVDARRENILVLGHRHDLGQHNVFLVDRVDGAGGSPEIIQRLKVTLDPVADLRGTGSPDIMRIIGRLPAVQAFVHPR